MATNTLYFYILVDPRRHGSYKVGITRNLKNRIKSYHTLAPESYYHTTYKIPDRSHESKIIYELAGAFRVTNEVVHGNLNIIQNIVEGYLTDHDIEY